MPTYFTPILTGAAANAQTINNPLTQLDNAVIALAAHVGAPLNLPTFNAAGNGVTDDSDALEDALAAGGVIIGKPGATYRVTRELAVPSNTLFNLNGATILQDAPTDIFAATGTQSSKVVFTSNQSAGSVTVALPTGEGANWSAGDLIMLESDTVTIDVSGTDTFAKELHKVKSVSSDTLTLDGALIWSHTTANTAKYSKITPKSNITFCNGHITNGADATNTGYPFQFYQCENVNLFNMQLVNVGGGIQLYDTYHANIDNLLIERVMDFTIATGVAFGYGVLVASATAFVNISNYTAHDLRHAFTTIAEQRGGALYGDPRHIRLAHCFGDAAESTDSTAIWDTHQAGYDVEFNDCLAAGGNSATAAFQLRSPVRMINCKALRVGGRAVNAQDGSEGSEIIGGEFAYCGGAGSVTTRSNYRIIGAHVHHCSNGGISTTGDYVEIKNCRVHDNTGAGINYSSGATNRIIIENNYVPFSSGVQTVGVQSAPATAIIRHNDFSGGYSGANALASVSSSALVQNNLGFVTESNGTGTINSGATTATITHLCNRTPTIDEIQITFGEQGSNDYGRWWIDTITSTQFRVNVTSDPGASNLDFGWSVTIR